MPEFTPIDHKESDPDYVAQVRKMVAKRIGAELLPIEDATFWIGRWRSCLGKNSPGEYDIAYLQDSTFKKAKKSNDAHPDRWKLEGDAYFETTWVPPMPAYGMEKESWSQEAYRCARTADGRIVYWNGDISLVVILTPVK